MSDGAIQIPIEVVAQQALGELQGINAQLAGMGTAADRTATATSRLSTTWAELNGALQIGRAALQSVSSAAEGIANLSAEAESLARNSERLGLNFDQAAAGAGRFVDETEAMALASQLAEAGFRVTQEQLDGLTRRAAQFAQNTGTTTTEAMQRLFAAIESGNSRSLRPFGEEMLALSGDTHTAEERIAGFIGQAERMPQATDSAASALDRFKDSISDATRAAAEGFAREFLRAHQSTDALDEHAGAAERLTAKMTTLGEALAHAETAAERVFVQMTSIVGLPMGFWATALTGNLDHLSRAWRNFNGDMEETARIGRSWRDHPPVAPPPDPNALSEDDTTGGTGWHGEGPSEGLTAQQARNLRRLARASAHHGGGGGGGHAPHRSAASVLDEMIERAQSTRGQMDPGYRDAENIHGVGFDAGGQYNGGGAANVEGYGPGDQSFERERSAADKARALADNRNGIGNRIADQFRLTESAADRAKDSVVSAFGAMTDAASKHFDALVEGRESAGEALQGFVHDTLSALAKVAAQQTIFEAAAGFVSLATYQYDKAVEHFTASALYAAVAVAAGAGAAATAPSASSAGSGKASPSLPASGGASNASPAGNGNGGQVVNIYMGGSTIVGPGGVREAASGIRSLILDGYQRDGHTYPPGMVGVGG